VAKAGTFNQDCTISLEAAVRSYIKKQNAWKPQFVINTYLIVEKHKLNLHECQQHSCAGSEYQQRVITVGFTCEMLTDLEPRIHHASNTES
jgi:hypothetical protein